MPGPLFARQEQPHRKINERSDDQWDEVPGRRDGVKKITRTHDDDVGDKRPSKKQIEPDDDGQKHKQIVQGNESHDAGVLRARLTMIFMARQGRPTMARGSSRRTFERPPRSRSESGCETSPANAPARAS